MVSSIQLGVLNMDPQYVDYGLTKWSANINHLAFADDTIIFTSSNGYSLEKIMSIL